MSQIKTAETIVNKTIVGNDNLTSAIGQQSFTNENDVADFGRSLRDLPEIIENEFYGEFMNKIVFQRAISTYNFKDKIFKKYGMATSMYGDNEEIVDLDIVETETYSETSSLLEVKKGTPYVAQIQTKWNKKWRISVTNDILRGAMLSASILIPFVNKHVLALENSFEFYKHQTLVPALMDNDAIPVVINLDEDEDATLVTLNDEQKAKRLYKGISRVISAVEWPSRIFNEKSKLNNLNREDVILILNPATKARFDIQVLASLFNKQVAEFKFETMVLPFPEAMRDYIGVVIPKSRFYASTRINTSGSFYDIDNLMWKFIRHNWMRYGHIAFATAFKISEYDAAFTGVTMKSQPKMRINDGVTDGWRTFANDTWIKDQYEAEVEPIVILPREEEEEVEEVIQKMEITNLDELLEIVNAQKEETE